MKRISKAVKIPKLSISSDGLGLIIFIPINRIYEVVKPHDCLNAQGDIEMNQLTPRQREVFTLLCTGVVAKEIAGKLNISLRTVKHHLEKIYSRLHMQRTDILRTFGVSNKSLTVN
jgi:DNA-binding CsgD family transcriptional regulator